MGRGAFKTQIGEALKRRVAPLPKGRPPNDDLDEDRVQMKYVTSYRLRKCSDINMDLPYFEVIDDEEVLLFDISRDGTKGTQILFGDGAVGKSIPATMMAKIIKEAKDLLDAEEA